MPAAVAILLSRANLISIHSGPVAVPSMKIAIFYCIITVKFILLDIKIAYFRCLCNTITTSPVFVPTPVNVYVYPVRVAWRGAGDGVKVSLIVP